MRKVQYARLHQSVNLYIPGVGDIGNVLPPTSKSLDNLDMRITEYGLSAKFKFQGVHKEVLVPLAGVAVMLMASEEPKKPSLAAVS